jgi:Na+-transporting NADH:ubiquinone oxidoreductase subunit B
MAFNSLFKKQKSNTRNSRKPKLFAQWISLLKHIFYCYENQTRKAPHIRANNSVQALLNNFIIASIPCWLIGLWNLGYQINMNLTTLGLNELSGWQGALLAKLSIVPDPSSIYLCFLIGLLYFIPIFIAAFLSTSIWEVIFARVRQRPFSEGVLAFAWLFSMLMPAGIDLYKVILGVSFGYVVGTAIFGGYGRYLVSPVLLGVVFLLFSYPELVYNPEIWVPVPGADVMLALNYAASGGQLAVESAGLSWLDLFIGIRPGPIGSVSVLGCVVGAVYLVLTNSASFRIIIGGLIGMFIAVLIYTNLTDVSNPMSTISASWHLVLGAFMFGLVFFATDPVASATTSGGRWVYGILVGILAIIIRISNPSYNEGILFAILLTSLFSPVIDFCFVEMNIRKRRKRLKKDLNTLNRYPK